MNVGQNVMDSVETTMDKVTTAATFQANPSL